MASRRGYLTQAELAEFANITITNVTEADDQISQAEEMIDAYVGYVKPHVHNKRLFGVATSATSTTLVDNSGDSPLNYQDNFYLFCEIEIIGGTGAGQRRIISGSSKDNYRITISSAWTTTPDTTSAYRIYQLGKFPRHRDIFWDSENQKYYKSIPEAIKRATAAQVQYIIEMGAEYFASAQANMKREQISDYEYEVFEGQSRTSRLISPKAQELLRGYVVRTGRDAC